MKNVILSGKGLKQHFDAACERARKPGITGISFKRSDFSLEGKGLLYAGG